MHRVCKIKKAFTPHLNRAARSTLGLEALRLKIGSINFIGVEDFLAVPVPPTARTMDGTVAGHNQETA